MTEGKSRITSQDLYECISAKNRVLGFLDCLIDEKNFQSQLTNNINNEEQASRKQKAKNPKIALEIED